jgi:acyl-CoA synthetase (NDP forming)
MELKKMLPPNASYRNPIDCAFDMNLPYFYITLPEILMKSGEVDAIVQYGVVGFQDVMDDYLKNEKIAHNAEFGHQSDEDMNSFAKKLVEPTVNNSKKYGIPIIHVSPMPFNSPWSKRLRKNGFILFKLWDRPVNALAKICQYTLFIDKIRQKNNK